MVVHPDEKAGKYACTWSSSIAVKLSASAIHTHASLSVHMCLFPVSIMPKEKKNTWIRMYTQITCPDQGPIPRRHRTTLHTPGAWRALYPTLKESSNGHPELQFPWNGASRDMWAFDRHSMFNHRGRGRTGGQCSGSPRAHAFGKTPSIRLKSGASVQACWEVNCAQSTGHLHASSSASLPSTWNHGSPHAARHPGGF